MAEQVDAADLKSVVRKDVPVRFRPSAPSFLLEYQALNLRAKAMMLGSLFLRIIEKQMLNQFASIKTVTGEQNV